MKAKQGEKLFTVFQEGSIAKYFQGDEEIDNVEIVSSFAKAKERAISFLMQDIEEIKSLKMRDVK